MVTKQTVYALHQCRFVNFLTIVFLALSLPLILSCDELNEEQEEQEEQLRSDPCVQNLLNGIPRTFRTSGTFFTPARTEAYAGDLFFLIAYGKPILSGIYVSPGFLDSVHETLEDPEFSDLASIFDNRGLEAAYRACHSGELVSLIYGSIDSITAPEIARTMLEVRMPWE